MISETERMYLWHIASFLEKLILLFITAIFGVGAYFFTYVFNNVGHINGLIAATIVIGELELALLTYVLSIKLVNTFSEIRSEE